MPAREKDAHLGSVVERMIYIQDRWMAVALCGLYSWTAGCVMVTEPNTRPTVVLTLNGDILINLFDGQKYATQENAKGEIWNIWKVKTLKI